jgi:hypothetical protein
MVLFFFPLGFGLLGLLFRRWWVVGLAVATWIGIAVYLRLNNGWYGAGWGEGGIALNVFVAGLTVLASAIGPAIRSSLRPAYRGARLESWGWLLAALGLFVAGFAMLLLAVLVLARR